MNLERKRVNHKKYGNGEITKKVDNYVYVKFQNIDEIKTFVYPSCFEGGYLKFRDEKYLVKKEYNSNIIKHMNDNKNSKKQSAKTVDDFCEEYKKALKEEIYYLRNNGGKKQSVFEGNLIELKKNKVIDYMYIPDGILSDCYIDFEIMNTFNKNLIMSGIESGKHPRIASLNQLGYYFFIVKLTVYLMRKEDAGTLNNRNVGLVY